MKKIKFVGYLTTVLLLFWHPMTSAQLSGDYEKMQPTFKQVIVETVYPLKISAYKADTFLSLKNKRGNSKYESPEAVLEAHFQAMKEGDFESFLATWSEVDRARIRNRIIKSNRSLDQVVKDWKLQFDDNVKLSLVNYIEIGSYVLVQYKFLRKSVIEIDDTLALRKYGDGWLLTQDLRNDPVLSDWNNATGRIRVPSNLLLSPNN